jgi:hypothetical protein
VGAGHVIGDGGVASPAGAPGVAGHPLALMEGLYRPVGDADVDELADQPVRNRVEAALHLHMVVGRDPAALPGGEGVGLARQRLQRRGVHLGEQFRPAGPIAAHDAGVQFAHQLTDGQVELSLTEEPPVAQPGHHPPLDQQDRLLDLGLVARLVGPGGHDAGPIVPGHLLVGAVDRRLVSVGLGHPRLEVVADDDGRDPAQEGEERHMAGDPVGEPLAGPGLRIDIGGRAHGGDEQLHRLGHAGRRIDDIQRVTGVVDEHLLAGDMPLTHGRRDPPLPLVEVLAEPGVAEPVRVIGAVLLPEQRPGHALAAQIGVHIGPVGLDPRLRPRDGRSGKQPPFERRIGQISRQRPAQPRGHRSLQVVIHRALAHTQRGGDRPARQAVLELQTQQFAYPAHRQSLAGHQVSSCKTRACVARSDCRSSLLHPLN